MKKSVQEEQKAVLVWSISDCAQVIQILHINKCFLYSDISELESIGEEAVMVYVKVLPRHPPGAGRDSNWAPPKYKSESLPLVPTCLAQYQKFYLFLCICLVSQQLKHTTDSFIIVLHNYFILLGPCPKGYRTLCLV